jgi:hypothetical protein
MGGRTIGRVERVLCIRQDGTAYDMNAERDAPKLTPVEKK